MMRFSELDPARVNPIGDPRVFAATLDGYGSYTTEHFVPRD